MYHLTFNYVDRGKVFTFATMREAANHADIHGYSFGVDGVIRDPVMGDGSGIPVAGVWMKISQEAE